MLKNYFKVTIRNILRHRMFTFINVFGLALAMSVCLLIILMLADQRQYDSFHTKKDRIYRIVTHTPFGRQPYATSSYPLAAYLKSNYGMIEEAITLMPEVTGDVFAGERSTVLKGYFADQAFMRMFDFALSAGDRNTALTQPRSLVISEDVAHYLFPNEDALGKVVQFNERYMPFPIEGDGSIGAPNDWGTFTITGILRTGKEKSHLKFSVLMSHSTLAGLQAEKKKPDLSNNWNMYFRHFTFVMVKEGIDAGELQAALNEANTQISPRIQEEYSKGQTWRAQALPDVQLQLSGNDTDTRMPIEGYWLLGTLAIIIMLSACLNYMNLSVARALTRAKEIGIRKVTGAKRSSLVAQFLGESIIISVMALLMAIVFLQALAPAFRSLWLNKYLRFELAAAPGIYLTFLVFAIVIGVIAGLYPAAKMSGYQPIAALKKQDSMPSSRWGLRKILSVSQFCVSLLFITTSILIFNQFKHYVAFDYGMQTENIINLNLQGHESSKVANEFSTIPGIVAVSACDIIPATGTSNSTEVRKPGTTDEYTSAYVLNADENFTELLGVEMMAGRNELPSADTLSTRIVVNETFAKTFGFPNPAHVIGQTFENKYEKAPMVVVGVVKDFRFQLPLNKHETSPMVMFNRPNNFSYLNLKVSTSNVPELLASIQSKWKQIDPTHPIKYEFYNDELASTHKGILDVVSILGFLSFLAIVIACLGLLGMATYIAERRKREVGIRKVLGAADWAIALLLSKSFVRVLGTSVLIGAPASYFLNNLWLQELPNRVDFGFETVALAALVLLVLGVLTIGSQTIRASRANPVDTIKDE